MNSRGAETKGLLEVEDQSTALARIKEMQLFPTRIVQERHTDAGTLVSKVFRQGGGSGDKGKVGSGGSSRRLGLQLNVAIPGFRNWVSTKALGVFTEELATLLQAGLPASGVGFRFRRRDAARGGCATLIAIAGA